MDLDIPYAIPYGDPCAKDSALDLQLTQQGLSPLSIQQSRLEQFLPRPEKG